MKFILRLILLVNLCFAFALLLSYLAPIVDPRKIWIFQIFGLFYHFILATNLFFVLFWLFAKRKYALVSIVVIGLGVLHIPKMISLNVNSSKEGDFKIMTFNMRRYISWKEGSGHKVRHENFAELRNLIIDKNPDVLFLQEDLVRYRDSIKLAGDFKYTCAHTSVIVYSKYPLHDCLIGKGDNYSNGYVFTKIHINNDTMNLIAVHLPTNSIGSKDLVQLQSEKLKEKKTWYVLGSTLKRYKEATKKRKSVVDELKEKMESSPYSTIIAGDFNEVPMSNIYSTLIEGKNDAFVEAGFGFGVTFKRLFHSLRIDYVLVDKDISISNYEILPSSFSDHYPSIAYISLASQAVKK